MTAKIVQDNIQRHKVLRKRLSSHHSDKEATASDYTEFTTTKTFEGLITAARFSLYSYITNNTSCIGTLPWFI